MDKNKIRKDREQAETAGGLKITAGLAADDSFYQVKEKVSEIAIQESENLFRKAFEFAATGMYICGLEGRLLKTNAAFSGLLGYTEDELLLMHFNDITHPDDLSIGLEHFQKLSNGEIETASFENRYISKNNISISVFVSLSLVRDNYKKPEFFITHVLDFTKRKQAEETLLENERLYETFMNSTSDLAYLKDENLKYIMTNRKLQEFFNKSDQEIVGKDDFELMPQENASTCRNSDFKVLENSQMIISTEVIRGKVYETRKFPISLKSKKTGIGAFIKDVTEQVNAEKELQKLSQVVQQSPVSIIVTNTDGQIEYVNPATCHISGYMAEDLIGENPGILSSGELGNEDFRTIWEGIKDGNEWKGEFRNRKKNGDIYMERASISPIKNHNGEITHYLSIQEDITEQKHRESIQKVLFNISKQVFETDDIKQLLEIVRNELSTLIDTSNFYVAFYDEETGMLTSGYVEDEKDTITSWPAEKSLTGYVVKNNKSLMLKHADFQNLIKTGEVELVGSDSEIWLGVPLTVDGKPYGAFVVQDYHNPNAYSENELKMLEFIASQVSFSIQRQKSLIELQNALVKAEASDRLKTAFINNISHEIRTPLNGILGFSEMTLSKDSTPEDNELFHTVIKKSSNRLLNTVTSYMDIAMIVSGTMELSRHPSNLEKLCDEIYNDFIEICKHKGLTLNLKKAVLPDPLILNTDIEKIRKILTHLLDNAVKFTPKGSITFGYEIKEKDFVFFVSDTGTGIKPDAINIIFDPFMQADVSSTRGYEGSGLGLAIVNGLVKLLGGNLWVDSQRAEGSAFYFTLPASDNPLVTPRKAIKVPGNFLSAKPLILVAEDDDSNYKYLEIVLQYASYRVIRAENGYEAIDCCRNLPEISLVLMDIKMPLLDGFEATRQIRAFMPNLPVIALSAHVTSEDEKAAMTAGCSEYLAKPVSKAKLLEIINDTLY